jgi:hypothetical protein
MVGCIDFSTDILSLKGHKKKQKAGAVFTDIASLRNNAVRHSISVEKNNRYVLLSRRNSISVEKTTVC